MPLFPINAELNAVNAVDECSLLTFLLIVYKHNAMNHKPFLIRLKLLPRITSSLRRLCMLGVVF